MSRKPRGQRAILTLTDSGPGRFKFEVEFRPPIRTDAPMSPAVAAAVNLLGSLVKANAPAATANLPNAPGSATGGKEGK